MRDDDRIKNSQDVKMNIDRPVILVTVVLAVIVGVMVWLGIRNPVIFSAVRDFLITFSALFIFILGAAFAVLCFFLASRVNGAKKGIDDALTSADGKVEELGVKIEEILKNILEPVVKIESQTAGFLHIFSKR